MRKIDKFLAKLPKDLRTKILAILKQMSAGDFSSLNLKKLKDRPDEYRVRVGRIRIKFYMNEDGIKVYDIQYRNDNTY